MKNSHLRNGSRAATRRATRSRAAVQVNDFASVKTQVATAHPAGRNIVGKGFAA